MGAFRDRIGDRLNHPERVPPAYRHLIADDVQRVRRIVGWAIRGAVLDVGCSDGAITAKLAFAHQARVVGADVELAPETWKEILTTDFQNPSYVQWDARQPWPYLDGPFDGVYACEFFEHLTDGDADQALTNILAVLKVDGDLIVTLPNKACADRYVAGCRDRWKWPDHRSAWDLPKLRAWLMPHFRALKDVPLYDGEDSAESIFLIMRAVGKR